MLQVAAYGSHAAVVDSLITAGFAVDETDERGKTALMFAAAKGHLPVVEQLLKAGADVNRTNSFGFGTALLYAIQREHTAVVDALLAAGARTDMRNRDGECALTMASRKVSVVVVEKLLEAGTNVDQPVQNHDANMFDGFTVFIFAAHCGRAAVATMLLKAGAHVDATDARDSTALMYACQNGFLETVDLLLAAGANVHHAAVDGTTALHLTGRARNENIPALVHVLVADGADINGVDQYGQTPLASAANGQDPDLARSLVVGANLHHDHQSALLAASVVGAADIVAILLASGADVNHHASRGETPLLAPNKTTNW